MAANSVLCSKSCSLQNPDKTLTEGVFYVYQTLLRFTPKGGGAKLDLAVDEIQGQKRSKNNPLLMLETRTQGKPVFKFNTTDDRDAAVAAIEQARAAPAAAQAPTSSTAGTAATQASQPTAASTAGQHAAAVAVPAVGAGEAAIKLSAEQRQLLLANNKAIAAQHKALVVDSKALTDDEFWASAAVQKAAGLTGAPGPTARSSRKGLANRLIDLARQMKTSDGQVAQLTMTSEDEQQLLAENPALRQLYEAQVPHIMTRGDFWGRYLKYYMAKKAKRNKAASKFKQLQQNLAADSAAIVADMGGDDAAADENHQLEVLFSTLDAGSSLDTETRKALKRRLNPVLDLASAAEDRLTTDGYGLAHNASRSEVEVIEGYQSLSSQLVQDYNVHSATVLGPPVSAVPKQQAAAAGPSSSAAAAAPPGEVDSEMTEAEAQQYRQNAGIVLEDLQAPPQQQFEELRVTDPRLYFKSTQQQQQQLLQQQQKSSIKKQQLSPAQLVGSINPSNLLDPPFHSAVAQQVLQELTSADVGGGGRGGPASLPQEQLDFVQQQSMVIDELLRHFWGLLPVNTNEKKAKFLRIQKSMDVCYEVLNKRIDQAEHAHKHTLTRLVKPLWDQLDNSITAAKNVERELQRKQQQAQQRRAQQQQGQRAS